MYKKVEMISVPYMLLNAGKGKLPGLDHVENQYVKKAVFENTLTTYVLILEVILILTCIKNIQHFSARLLLVSQNTQNLS